MTKRSHGEGGIDERGEGVFRLRWRTEGKRHAKTFRGTLGEARKELRKLVRAVDTGEHVDPAKSTLGQWIADWLAAGAPGRRKKRVGERTLERYGQLLNTHVVPALGAKHLQKLQSTDIDRLYTGLEGKIAPRTRHHVHVVFGACLATAHRKKLIAANPMMHVEQVPNPQAIDSDQVHEDDIGEGLDEAELAKLIAGFRTSGLMYAAVAVDAATGLRRNELLALRWSDFDEQKKKLRVERALEQTKRYGIRVKPPKTKRGYRTIDLDDETVRILVAERSRCQRLLAGIPDSAGEVDLGLIKLPERALIFPAVPDASAIDLSKPRNPRNFSKEFARRAEVIGFGRVRFHDLRGIHSTALLDAGIPVNRVAERIGDDPAVLLRSYAKRKRSRQADASMSTTLNAIASGFLGSK